jgi:serine/threonine protein kinase
MSEKIGPYTVIRSIGKGGMGEVLLVSDPVCEREIALKRIRQDLPKTPLLRSRFLHEAKLTSQLTHPGIISIYSISEEEQTYYTMPYVEGKTLKQILRGDDAPSIPQLLSIFKSICQTTAYIHSKSIIHRDLKPENILVGNFGEVIILDWGLAESIHESLGREEGEEKEHYPELTHPGKVVGTLAYMAPERILGAPATMQTDIYALGVILYQVLTIHLPFERGQLKEVRKHLHLEKLPDPEEIAPYRDVPPPLSRMVKKALAPNIEERYQSMEELIHDLVSHMEGRSEWFESLKLHAMRKKDWEFQENVLVSKHMAITRTPESATWLSLMISRASFAENTRLQTKVRIGKEGAGIGFLLCVPEAAERETPLSGFCLWLGTESEPFSQLFRNTIEVMRLPDLYLTKEIWHTIQIEQIENHIHFILDGVVRFRYVSHLPLVGTHVGTCARDADYEMEEIVVSIGGQNLTVSCLSVPDAFLASRDYKRAIAEYRRIGASFPGHYEGREGLFRAGITLLEQAKTAKSDKRTENFYSLALEEFGKLHSSPGAPLEYLGKALVYQSMGDQNEEVKCLELALRRYGKHPLAAALREQILYRMHESAQNDRVTAYKLILIAFRQIPESIVMEDSKRLFRHLLKHSEPLPFIENPLDPSRFGRESDEKERKLAVLSFETTLSFWLANPYTLKDIIPEILTLEPLDAPAIGNLLYALFEMGSFGLSTKWMKKLKTLDTKNNELTDTLALLEPLITCHSESLASACIQFFSTKREDIGVKEMRTLSYLMQYALKIGQEEMVEKMAQSVLSLPIGTEDRIQIDAYRIWAYLAKEKWKEAGDIFDTYPIELLNQESTLLHPLFGCYLYATEGEEIAHIHFAGVIDTPFPRSWALLGHELTNKITHNSAWFKTSFMWERRMLYRQLTLYYHCSDNPELESYYRHLERQEYIYVPD